MHVSLNKPSSIRCVARQSRPPVRILIAINGKLITDEHKYSTEIVEIPISQYQHQHPHAHNQYQDHAYGTGNDENNVAQSNRSLSATARRRHQLKSYSSGLSNIASENLRSSYYDTHTNLTIDDISMQMQDQVVECFAYSFLATSSTSLTPFNANKLISRFDAFQDDVMSTKSTIQVDCKLHSIKQFAND